MLPQNNDRNGGTYEKKENPDPDCPCAASVLCFFRHGLRCRHRRCSQRRGEHLENGLRSDQDRGEQCSLSRHRPDPGGILLRQVGDGLFRLQKKRPVRVDGACHPVCLPGVHADGSAVHLADHRDLRYRQ